MTKPSPAGSSCPVELLHDTVQLAHGGGGRHNRDLIEQVFLSELGAPAPADRHDSFVTDACSGRLALTTDSYVVTPYFFPGGNIGELAVIGTCNDLAVAGARAKYLTAGFVLEEGLPIEDLRRIVQSMRRAAEQAQVRVVSGDTKVVDRGHGHGVYINTAGVGFVAPDVELSPARIRAGDAIVLSGDLGRHGIAVMSRREGLQLRTELTTDCAPLWPLIHSLLETRTGLHCARDLTRGGLASALNELAADAGLDLALDEAAIPVGNAVRGACELLGLDPLYVANEGRCVVFVPAGSAQRAVEVLRKHDPGRHATVIGEVLEAGPKARREVVLRGNFAGQRLLPLLSGEQLPRIC